MSTLWLPNAKHKCQEPLVLPCIDCCLVGRWVYKPMDSDSLRPNRFPTVSAITRQKPICMLCSRLPCYVFCICLLTNMSYNKYLSPPPTQQIKIRNTNAVELGDQLFVVCKIESQIRRGKASPSAASILHLNGK